MKNHSPLKKDRTDSSNEFYLETRSMAGEEVKYEQMPVYADIQADIHSHRQGDKLQLGKLCTIFSFLPIVYQLPFKEPLSVINGMFNEPMFIIPNIQSNFKNGS
jgi:hypothetical protein